MNVDIENTVKLCATFLKYQQTETHEKTVPYEMSYNPQEMVGADTFSIKNNMPLCLVHYYSKFPVVKKADGLLADDLIKAAKIVFAEFGLLKRIVSDAGTNLISDKFKNFCSC